MKLSTLLLAGYVVVFALMIFIAGVTYQSINTLIKHEDTERRAQEIKTKARVFMRVQVATFKTYSRKPASMRSSTERDGSGV